MSTVCELGMPLAGVGPEAPSSSDSITKTPASCKGTWNGETICHEENIYAGLFELYMETI